MDFINEARELYFAGRLPSEGSTPVYHIVLFNPCTGEGHVSAHTLHRGVALRLAIVLTREQLQDSKQEPLPKNATEAGLEDALTCARAAALQRKCVYADVSEQYALLPRYDDRAVWDVLMWDRTTGRVHMVGSYDNDDVMLDAMDAQRAALKLTGAALVRAEAVERDYVYDKFIQDGYVQLDVNTLRLWKDMALKKQDVPTVFVSKGRSPSHEHMLTRQYTRIQ